VLIRRNTIFFGKAQLRRTKHNFLLDEAQFFLEKHNLEERFVLYYIYYYMRKHNFCVNCFWKTKLVY